MKIRAFAALAFLGAADLFTPAAFGETTTPDNDLTLWYLRPSEDPINESLPIGNGRIGSLISGGTARERLVLNEDSLWTGTDDPAGVYDNDKNDEFGSYQVLGNLYIDLPGHDQGVSNYRRDLDIGTALAHVSYTVNGVDYRREYFCSHPGQVMVARLTASRPGSYTGTIELADGRKLVTRQRTTRSVSPARWTTG